MYSNTFYKLLLTTGLVCFTAISAEPARAEALAGPQASVELEDSGGRDAADTDDVVLSLAALRGGSSNARVAFDFFVGKGLTGAQAAGIIGNLMQESSMNPASTQRHGAGRGIAQWSSGARWNNLLRFARARHASPLSLRTQLDFLWHELTTVAAYGLRALRVTRDVVAATRTFERSYESCGDCHERQRIAFAKAALKAYGKRASRRRA